MKLRDLFLTIGFVGVYGAGCVIEVSRSPYEPCSAGDLCSGATSCQSSAYTVSGTGPANICTSSCTAGSSCPTNGSGYGSACVINPTSGLGQCLQSCRSDANCSFGTRCAILPTTPAIQACVPSGTGTPVTCGGSGQTCCSGNACSAGLSCISGTCQSLPQPYQSCTPVGAQCAGGTTCVQAQARAPGGAVGNTCTAACPTGVASTCPGFVAGQVECVNLPGDMPFQCMRLCNAASDCTPYSTQCLQVVTKTGNTIRVCAP